MKKLILSSVLISSLFATEENYIEFGAMALKTDDNFSTSSKKNISSLNGSGSENDALPYIEFLYAYKLADSYNVYLKSFAGEFNLGSKISSNLGNFDLGLKMNLLNEEWENPFLTNTNREETDTKEFGAYIAYELLSNSKFKSTIKYEISNKSYDNDTVQSELKRDGVRNIISMNNMYHSSLFNLPTTYLNKVSFENYQADGDASSYNEVDLAFGLTSKLSEKLRMTLLTNIGKQDYDAINPVLNKSIDVDIYGVKAIFKYDKPFDYKNTYVSFKTGIEKENANDNFYDKESAFGIVSLGYKF
jgi:hypothetical protein